MNLLLFSNLCFIIKGLDPLNSEFLQKAIPITDPVMCEQVTWDIKKQHFQCQMRRQTLYLRQMLKLARFVVSVFE